MDLFRVILAGSIWLTSAIGDLPEGANSCDASGGVDECEMSAHGPSLLQHGNTRVRLEQMGRGDHEEEMLEDDILDDETQGEDSRLGEGMRDNWTQIDEGKVCAMDEVESRVGLKYAMYGVFEASAGALKSFGNDKDGIQSIRTAKATNSVIVAEWIKGQLGVGQVTPEHRWGTTDKVASCQEIARKKMMPYIAMGAFNGKDRCYVFTDCNVDTRVPMAGFTIYKDPYYGKASNSANEQPGRKMSCSGEATIKEELESQLKNMKVASQEENHHPANAQWRPLATVLRAVFHDAHDFNSLMAINRTTNNWSPVGGSYAGVDGCMYDNGNSEMAAQLSGYHLLQSDNQGAQAYNQHLERTGQNQDFVRIDRSNFKFMRDACYNLCCGGAGGQLSQNDKVSLCGTETCSSGRYFITCAVDLTVYGSLLIIEKAGGPSVPMTWGRVQADCRKPFENIDVPEELDTRRIAQGGASLSSFGKAADVFAEFAHLGLNKSEAVAAMGAHTFGKLHYYTGGPFTRSKGQGFCDDFDLVKGYKADGTKLLALNQKDNLDEYSDPPGNCEKLATTADGGLACFTNERGFLEPSRGMPAEEYLKMSGEWTNPAYTDEERIRGVSGTWAGGGLWDTTPDIFDNDYFKMLKETDHREKNNCCGPSTENGCSTDGVPLQTKDGEEIKGCDINFCLRSSGDDTTLHLGGGSPTKDSLFPDFLAVSTNKYVQTKLGGNKHNGVHRIVRLAADWALIDDEEARSYVNEFADFPDRFNEAFAAVWSKIIDFGYPEETLKQCVLP